MVAVVEGGFCAPEQRRNVHPLTRVVAVVMRPAELCAGADLVHRLVGVPQIDLLLVTDGDEQRVSADPYDDEDDDEQAGAGDIVLDTRSRAAELGLNLDVHRLGLPEPAAVRPCDVDDVVAAVSELVGFDPDDDVGCLVPRAARAESLLPGTADGPADVLVGRAVERVVAAYGLPVVTYVPQAI
jgi:hypothetical protein